MPNIALAHNPQKITVVGTGYVGLVSGVCFAELGHEVVCVDKDPHKVKTLRRGDVHIYEPGLADVMDRCVKARRISFTDDLTEAARGADAVFIAVGTPMSKGGRADLSYVKAAAEEIACAAPNGVVVVTKSTVPVGTNEKVRGWIQGANPDLDFEVASNPEFLREGAALRDFMEPDRIVVGVSSSQASRVMESIYAPLTAAGYDLLVTDLASAEMIKYAANAFLAMKVGFINQVADLCEATGADVGDVARGIGSDTRIGPRFLVPGPGYGGSCFPKDTNAFVRIGEDNGVDVSIVGTVVDANDSRKISIADRVIALAGEGARVGVLGVTFKANTDDMREAPALTIIPRMQAAGIQVQVYDPQGRKEGERLLPNVNWTGSAHEAAREADLLLILTEWEEFNGLDLSTVAGLMANAVLFDTRGIFNDVDATASGFAQHHVIGRTPSIANENQKAFG